MTLDDFIGLPYREGGRGPDDFDCYGIVAAVFRALRGVELPDWYQEAPGQQGASRAIAAALAGEVEGGHTFKVEVPADWDIAIVGSKVRPHHVGLVHGGGVLHACREYGSVWQPFARFAMSYPQVEFYRWVR